MITVISAERQARETAEAGLFAQCLKVGGRWVLSWFQFLAFHAPGSL